MVECYSRNNSSKENALAKIANALSNLIVDAIQIKGAIVKLGNLLVVKMEAVEDK